MKILKLGLRVWFGIASFLAFLAGWIFLAHSPKPAPFSLAVGNSGSGNNTGSSLPATLNPTPFPTIAPPPSLDQLQNGQSQLQPLQVQPAPQLPSTQSFSPRIRTGGS